VVDVTRSWWWWRQARTRWLARPKPLLTAETVASLVDTYRDSPAPLALPVVDGARGHPVIFGPALFPELRDEGLEGGARSVVHRHLEEALLVPVSDPGAVTDIDTPEEYRAAFLPPRRAP
jgi:molybdenum cofactor cytidylyltransferase